MFDNYAALFNCTPLGRASNSRMAPTLFMFVVGVGAFCLLLGPSGLSLCFSFAPDFQ